MSPSSLPVRAHLRPISADDYHRMIEAGILGEDEHVQLVSGALVAMTPQGPQHAYAIQTLNRLFVRAVADDIEVRTQLPLTLADDSEPEPDLALVRAQDTAARHRHPSTALLVVEVSGDSLRFDRQTKAAVYARARIPEYWIVDLTSEVVEIFRDPDTDEGRYRVRVEHLRGEVALAESVDGVAVEVAVLFG